LTPEARDALKRAQDALASKRAHRFDPKLPFQLAILGKMLHLHGLIHQWDEGQKDPLLITEWVFLSNHPTKTITMPQERMVQVIGKVRSRLAVLAGCDFTCIYVPITIGSLEFVIQNNVELQYALDSYPGQLSIHYPKHKIFNLDLKIVHQPVLSKEPLKALTIFTDGSGASGKSVITWQDTTTQKWESDVEVVKGSPQVAELAAIIRAFDRFSEPFNLVTDSAYVAGVVSRAKGAWLLETNNPKIHLLLSKLVKLVFHRKQPFFVMHVRSHTDLPGFISKRNRMADVLAEAVHVANLPDVFQQAKLSHALFHQNVPALIRMINLRKDQAKAIAATCPNCQPLQIPSMGAGVNPTGLGSGELWQMDVTHVPEFGRQKYVHVCIHTFSGAIYASAHSGEKVKDVIYHLIQAFSVLGVPKEVKMDNGPAYTLEPLQDSFQEWGISHVTGIPHSATGQALVDRAHQTLK
ncbi:POK19 protein, partial [Falcunculus frontatus]|nr:POK19 protein [Falcunculus frontatus]